MRTLQEINKDHTWAIRNSGPLETVHLNDKFERDVRERQEWLARIIPILRIADECGADNAGVDLTNAINEYLSFEVEQGNLPI